MSQRFHRTLLDEQLRVQGRTTWYETVEKMQQDLQLVHELDTRGFVIALIEPVSHDHAASSLLQVDCIFVKRDAGSGDADSPAV